MAMKSKLKVRYVGGWWWVVITAKEPALGPCVTKEQAYYIAKHPAIWADWGKR